MIITCEQCQARFRLADEKLKAGGTKVRCSKCKHVFVVLPPETLPAEETVDFDSLNMERVADEEPAPAPPEPAESPEPPTSVAAFPAEPLPEPPIVSRPESPTSAGGSGLDLDFSGLEQSMGPGGADELAEEFSFADTTGPAEEPVPADMAGTAGQPEISGAGEFSDEFDFNTPFAETEEPTTVDATAAEPSGFVFDEESTESATAVAVDDAAAFNLESGESAVIGEEFSFEPGQAASPESGFSFEAEAEDNAFTFGDESAGAEKSAGLGFDTQVSSEQSPLEAEPAFGEETAMSWSQPDKTEGPSFDFDEPSFDTQAEEKPLKRSDEAGLSFGEIDFSDEQSEETPSFGDEPDFSQASMSRPAETATPPPPPPPPRSTANRPRSEEPLPVSTLPSKNPMSRVLLILVLLLLILCGAGGYFYFMGNGQQVIDNLLLKVKGEQPAALVEQRIGLNIEGSSYVDNRDAGQLLVIQGSSTNNFSGGRSSIMVKGLILDAGGKVLQQQTVFCGNYLSEEKLRTMKYAQIEEAMNNEFGDSLANMNVKPGATIRFTIVFRNVPKEMANINVEVVDSKAGGM